MNRQMQQYQTAEELEIMMASAPPTTVGNDRGARDQIPMKPKRPLVLSRSDSETERLLLIRTLQSYSKTTNSPPRRAEQEDDDDDNKSAQSVRSSVSWWRGGGGGGRSARVDDVQSGIPDRYARSSSSVGGQRRRNLPWKRKKSTPRKPSNDQLVMDLFDMKSMASEPEFVGSKKFQLYSRHKTTKLLDHHETRSVSSSRSLKSFSLYFQQAFRNSNGMDDDDDDDDELTMASGLADDFVSSADDGSSVVSGITLEPPNFQRAVSEGAYLTPSHKSRSSSKKPSFLHRFYRKIRRSRATSTSHPPPAETTQQIPTEVPVDEEEEVVQATTAPPPSLERFDTVNVRAPRVDRWSPTPQYDDEVAPQAPKRPLRRQNSDRNFQPILEEETKQDEKEDDECSEDKDDEDEDDDDDSVISLLSGLLATWTSERNAQQQAQQNRAGADSSHEGPKSCLKTSLLPSEMNGRHSALKPRFSVAFDRIKIREYERALGDNPSCTSGPPISLGWTYLHSCDYPIDEYERNKTVRRSKREFRLPAGRRTELLMQEWECLEDDIRKACREATYVQYCREKAVLSRARQREREREAAAMRSKHGGPRPDMSDTAQPPPAQLRHRSSVEIGCENATRSAKVVADDDESGKMLYMAIEYCSI